MTTRIAIRGIAERITIAVFGDLHGHFTLAYRLLGRWQREHGERIAFILQVGDLGAYPTAERVDKATMRFARKDPDELSFSDYYAGAGAGDAAEILDPMSDSPRRIDARMYFIKGNHEDFEFLTGLGGAGRPVPVDPYHKMFFLASGHVYVIEHTGHRLKVGSLGGVASKGGPAHDAVSPHYTRREVRSLLAAKCDVLLTHDAPYGAVYAEAGSTDVAHLVESIRPRFHFCGHYHEEGVRLDAPEGTESYLLNEVNFRGARRLNRGCVGILRWGGASNSSFEIVDEPWMAEYTRASYRQLP